MKLIVTLLILCQFLPAVELPHPEESAAWQKIAARFSGEEKVKKDTKGKITGVSISKLKGNPKSSATCSIKLDSNGHVTTVSSNRAAFTNDEYKYFTPFTKLKNLSLWHNGKYNLSAKPGTYPEHDGAGIIHLKNLTNLTTINLAGGSLDDKGLEALAQLPKLERLGIWHIHASNEGLKHLMNSKSIKGVRLGPNWMKKQNHESLQYLAKIPKLESLSFGETLMSYDILKEFLGQTKLKSLDLGNSLISEADVKKLQAEFKEVKIKSAGLAATGKYLKKVWIRKIAAEWIPKEKIDAALAAAK
ncbi:MAG: hypothetical protein NE330_23500 [Lentisphaeraceae bacterium]|nr:hypothetical protein [Lentisphaeraceae bacterium]